jgi:hypothetical protein
MEEVLDFNKFRCAIPSSETSRILPPFIKGSGYNFRDFVFVILQLNCSFRAENEKNINSFFVLLFFFQFRFKRRNSHKICLKCFTLL